MARSFLSKPNVVGAILPSSRFLARALMKHFNRRSRPADVLEIGAGTGAVTTHLAGALGPEDTLRVCEIDATMADHLDANVLSVQPLAAARREGLVELLHCPVQEIDRSRRYHYVISGLPFTAFSAVDLREILEVVRSVLAPGGVFSYFEYVALRRLRSVGSRGDNRRRMMEVAGVLDDHIRRFEFDRDVVMRNVPPAYARHLRFDSGA